MKKFLLTPFIVLFAVLFGIFQIAGIGCLAIASMLTAIGDAKK